MENNILISISIRNLNDVKHFETLIRLSEFDYNSFLHHSIFYPFLQDYHCSTINRVVDCLVLGLKENLFNDSTVCIPIKDSDIYNVSIHVEKL